MSKRKRDLSIEEWTQIGDQLKEADRLWAAVAFKIGETASVREVDRILRLVNRGLTKVKCRLENIMCAQHGEGCGWLKALWGKPSTKEVSPR